MNVEDGTVLDSETKSVKIGGAYAPSGAELATNLALIIGGFAGGIILVGLLAYFLGGEEKDS